MKLMLNSVQKGCAYLRNVTMWIAPFLIFLLSSALLIYILGANFEKYLDLLRVLVWPVTLLLALFFFRKVVTYLFFSMDEFNFFGAKGELKDIREIIDQRVEKRITDEKSEEKRLSEIKTIADELEVARKSKDSEAQQAKENFDLAQDIFKRYRDLSEQHASTTKEVEDLRRKEAAREARMQIIRDRMRNREIHGTARIEKPAEVDSVESAPKGEQKSTPNENK